jgi:hypothetical protein
MERKRKVKKEKKVNEKNKKKKREAYVPDAWLVASQVGRRLHGAGIASRSRCGLGGNHRTMASVRSFGRTG